MTTSNIANKNAFELCHDFKTIRQNEWIIKFQLAFGEIVNQSPEQITAGIWKNGTFGNDSFGWNPDGTPRGSHKFFSRPFKNSETIEGMLEEKNAREEIARIDAKNALDALNLIKSTWIADNQDCFEDMEEIPMTFQTIYILRGLNDRYNNICDAIVTLSPDTEPEKYDVIIHWMTENSEGTSYQTGSNLLDALTIWGTKNS